MRRPSVFSMLALAIVVIAGAPAAAARPPLQTPPTTRPTPASTTPPPTQPLPSLVGASPDGTDLPYLGDPRVDPDLGGVSVDTAEFRNALARYRTTEKNLQTSQGVHDDAVRHLAELEEAQVRLVGTQNQATRRHDKSADRLAVLQASLAQLAVDDYIRGERTVPAAVDLDIEAATERGRQRVVVKTVRSRQLAEARQHADVVRETEDLLAATTAELDDVHQRIAETTATRDRSALDIQRLSAQLVPEARAIADARLTGDVPGLDFSFVALDAYYKAAKRMAAEKPACGIRWTLLAGISRTEGHHGTFDGAKLDPNGNETKPILGIALDGSTGVALVADSDAGEYDGDPTLDRAVGPMQFIPSTWAKFGRDGNADGRIDPQNMYDAALAAAAYLCYFGPGITTDDAILGALVHYNNDAAYGQLVLERAKAYDAFKLPAPPTKSR